MGISKLTNYFSIYSCVCPTRAYLGLLEFVGDVGRTPKSKQGHRESECQISFMSGRRLVHLCCPYTIIFFWIIFQTNNFSSSLAFSESYRKGDSGRARMGDLSSLRGRDTGNSLTPNDYIEEYGRYRTGAHLGGVKTGSLTPEIRDLWQAPFCRKGLFLLSSMGKTEAFFLPAWQI